MRLFCDVMTYVFFNLLSEYRDTSFSLHAPSHQQANRPHKPVLTDTLSPSSKTIYVRTLLFLMYGLILIALMSY